MCPMELAIRVVLAAASATIGRAFIPRRASNLYHQGYRRLGTTTTSRIHPNRALPSPRTKLSSCQEGSARTFAISRNDFLGGDKTCSVRSWPSALKSAAVVSAWGRPRHLTSGERHVFGSLGGGGIYDVPAPPPPVAAAASPVLDDKLNESQWEAVTAAVGAIRIVAGPGSGKTRVLTQRIAHLVSNLRVPARSILAVTFTKKASEEMKARVREAMGNEVASRVSLGTFHSVCARLLWRHGGALSAIIPGLDGGFSIYDKEDSRRVIKEIIQDRGLEVDKVKPKAVCSAISRLKSEGLQPEDVRIDPDLAPGKRRQESTILEIYRLYQRRMIRNNALDFDDIILVALKLLQEDKEVFRAVGRQYRHVLVDEWQDTNGPQYQLVLELVRAGVEAQAALEEIERAADAAILASGQGNIAREGERKGKGDEAPRTSRRKSSSSKPRSTAKGYADPDADSGFGPPAPSVFVVGDSDQCIYRFRGADHTNVARFAEDFAGCRTVFLRENYRSTGNIARAATAVIEKVRQRIKQETVAIQSDGRPIGVMRCSDDVGEAKAVARQVELYLTSGRVPAGEMAVMYRTNAQSRSFEEAFVRRALPFVVVGAQRFYERREIKDCLAYLRILVNPCDSVAMRRAINTPARGIGPKTELSLQTLIASARGVSELKGVNEPECLLALLEDRELDELSSALPSAGAGSGVGVAGSVAWGGVSLRRARALGKALEAGDVKGPSKAQSKRLAMFAGLLCKLRVVAATQGMPELFRAIVDGTDMKEYVMGTLSTTGPSEGNDRWLNVLELERAATHHRFSDADTLSALETFLKETALMSSEDAERESREQEENGTGVAGEEGEGTEFSSGRGPTVKLPRIQMMTVHASKGLEFDTVFLTGVEEGTFPMLRKDIDDEEERRLMYVGMTRAKARLFLSCRDERTEITPTGLKRRGASPSRFIADIPKSIVRTIDRRTATMSRELGNRHPQGAAADRVWRDLRSESPRRRRGGEWGEGGSDGEHGDAERQYKPDAPSLDATTTRLFGDTDASPGSRTRRVAGGLPRRVGVGDACGGTGVSSGRSSQGYGDGMRGPYGGDPRSHAAERRWKEGGAGARDAKVFQKIRDELEVKRYPIPVVRDRGARLAKESGEGIDTSWAAKLVGSDSDSGSRCSERYSVLLPAGVQVGTLVSHPVHGTGEVVALVEGSERVNVRFESKGQAFVTRVLGSKLKALRQ